jgi:hypothetical protein
MTPRSPCIALVVLLALLGCKTTASAPAPAAPASSSAAHVEAPSAVAAAAPVDAAPPPPPPEPPRAVGPYQLPFGDGDKRSVYFAVPPRHASGQRLIANLHGMCNPPGYACGYWVHAGSEHGFLVCPAGNSECAPGVSTWTESWDKIDEDLEASVGVVDAHYPGEIDRDQGGILTGFSLGASVAPLIAEKHPGRWPYLILVEATVALDPAKLGAAGVRAVALVAGEIGANVYGDKAICDSLNKQGFPARCWVMPKAGHWYSANIDEIMGDAIDWLLTNGA